MNILDIILAIPLAYAFYRGFKDGVVTQLGGLVGIVIGIWLAIKFSKAFSQWLSLPHDFATEMAFVIIILATILLIGLVGRLLGKIFDMAGLGMFNKVGGILIALIKMIFILSVLLMAFGAINKKTEIVRQKYIDGSLLYRPISSLSVYIFPSMEYIKNTFNGSDE